MTRSKVNVMLNPNPPRPVKVTTNPYLIRYVAQRFLKFEVKRGNTQEHVVHLFDSIGAHFCTRNLCLREFSKSITERAYTWYMNLKRDIFMIGSVLIPCLTPNESKLKQNFC